MFVCARVSLLLLFGYMVKVIRAMWCTVESNGKTQLCSFTSTMRTRSTYTVSCIITGAAAAAAAAIGANTAAFAA